VLFFVEDSFKASLSSTSKHRKHQVKIDTSCGEKMQDDNLAIMCCASCGTAGGDDIKLKKCTACHLVRYCSVKCQRGHWPQHKKACKKRAAELRDELLFKQPESSEFGDCPICCLPLPLDEPNSIFMACCCKRICLGCDFANQKREREGRLEPKCAFCRQIMRRTEEEINEHLRKRIEVNDPAAICDMGTKRHIEGDFKAAFEYWTRAAVLGDVLAHYQLSTLYQNGEGVEKDEKKQLHHLEKAAIGGNPDARHNLGHMEEMRGRVDRAAKHFIIAAKLGLDESLECVKGLYKAGLVSKDDVVEALRGYEAAIDAMKSPQREEAAKYYGRKYQNSSHMS
jgi:tetratricopeptide (TPR) repeat protein